MVYGIIRKEREGNLKERPGIPKRQPNKTPVKAKEKTIKAKNKTPLGPERLSGYLLKYEKILSPGDYPSSPKKEQ
ncbi:hypothetical protein KBI33_04025, partial [Candidatus Shapirobacteria bacterium]|nr:hypothetical protein [Candidatus Shapirobacteria bacterium]